MIIHVYPGMFLAIIHTTAEFPCRYNSTFSLQLHHHTQQLLIIIPKRLPENRFTAENKSLRSTRQRNKTAQIRAKDQPYLYI